MANCETNFLYSARPLRLQCQSPTDNPPPRGFPDGLLHILQYVTEGVNLGVRMEPADSQILRPDGLSRLSGPVPETSYFTAVSRGLSPSNSVAQIYRHSTVNAMLLHLLGLMTNGAPVSAADVAAFRERFAITDADLPQRE